MSKPLIEKLQIVAKKALNSENVEEGMKYLATAFSLFSKETEKLKSSYFALKERFDDIHIKLDKTNKELVTKIKERNKAFYYLDSILKNISQGILFIDQEGLITTINKEAKNILDVEEEKILFQSFFKNFEDNFFGFSIKKSLQYGLSNTLSYITLSSKKQIEVSSTFINESSYLTNGMIILIRDVSEVKNLEQIANRNSRLKELGEMAATVAHEIKNPLGGIRGYASLLFQDLENSKQLQDMAGYILEGTKSLERLVNNVLHFTRKIDINLTLVDITALIKELYNFIKVDPSFSSSISFDSYVPNEKIYVLADKQLLKSAILNIILNAAQAIEENGTITISCLKHNQMCFINISDNGKGIPKDDIENIFSPFFTTKPSGNGLGLSEAYKIIQECSGNIEVRSEKEMGSTFTITLKIRDEKCQ